MRAAISRRPSTDYTTLTQDLPSSQNDLNSPFGQKLTALGQAIQSGNRSGAEQAYATLREGPHRAAGHHHHHHAKSSDCSNEQSNNPLDQILNELSQSLQSGDLSSAQQEFASLLQQLTSSNGLRPVARLPP